MLAAAPAGASESRFEKMFDVDPSSIERNAREAVAKMDGVCTYSQFSRLPPRPETMRECNAAEQKVVALGVAGARAAMAHLDEEKTPSMVRNRLYDIIGRSGDVRMIESLVVALEREAATPQNPRNWERYAMVRALQTLTYAELPGTPSIQWRIWFDEHKGQSREQLFAARAAESRESLDKPISMASVGARWLLAQASTRNEGAQALGRLFARADLSQQDRVMLNQVAYGAGITPPGAPAAQPPTQRNQPPEEMVPVKAAPQKTAAKVAGLAS
jgi:hypothetical protein